MHQTRQEITKQLPLPRKGTKYVVRAASHHSSAVPVLIAIRDVLHLAQTAREVKAMIKGESVKINGRLVRDLHESIKIFNTFEVDKTYRLILLPTGKFTFEETKEKDTRLCKVISKSLAKNKVVQLHLHDGTNIVAKDAIAIGDSVYLDVNNKVKKHVSLAKGKNAFITSGSYAGNQGMITAIDKKKISITINGRSTVLEQASVVVL